MADDNLLEYFQIQRIMLFGSSVMGLKFGCWHRGRKGSWGCL